MATESIPRKRCSCKDQCAHPENEDGWLPATREYFYKASSRTDGLNNYCKACAKARANQWYSENTERAKANVARYQGDHPEQTTATKRRHYDRNKAKIIARAREWRTADPDRFRKCVYNYTHSEKGRTAVLRRRARERSLPHTLTAKQWRECLEYWNNCCAYCGAQQDFWSTIAADHFIPLVSSACIGTVVENMIPACRFCNASKQHKDPATWLTERYGARRARAIIARIEAYFATVRETHSDA